ncbi:MAG: EF-P lysine aminoacylase EpmA [Planctomycetaceae bacterium]
MEGKSIPSTWQPTCSLNILRLRSELLKQIRRFFDDRNYTEVETPLLSHDVVVDTHINPIEVSGVEVTGADQTSQCTRMFLQTSPEAAMKRLLAAGMGSIYQITKSFRSSERGDRYNPEFTIIEWYGVGTDHLQQMRLTEDLVRTCIEARNGLDFLPGETRLEAGPQSFRVLNWDDAFISVLGESVLGKSRLEIEQLAASRQIPLPAFSSDDTVDDILNVILAERIEPALGIEHPVFLTAYPRSQAALARTSENDARVSDRFELYMQGVEICNGYHELTDVRELAEREVQSNSLRVCHKNRVLPGAERMGAAMMSGLPACSGVALGFDRLLMLLTGSTRIDQVIPFPIERA